MNARMNEKLDWLTWYFWNLKKKKFRQWCGDLLYQVSDMNGREAFKYSYVPLSKI